MLKLVAVAEWGGRAAGVDRVAEAVSRMLAGVPVPQGLERRDWFDLHDRTPVASEHEALVDWVERHRERGSDGAVQPLAGFTLDVAQGVDGPAADESLPFVTIAVMAGVVVGGPRMPANTVKVSASAGWMDAATEQDRVELVRVLAEAWEPARAATYDRDVTRGLPRLPPRTPWPGYATYFSSELVPDLRLPAEYRVTALGGGALAVLDPPWEASRALEGVTTFLAESSFDPIPEREPEGADRA
ncbi:hypothetical protein [Amnibacterium setariae]|uniref:Immunity protein 52 domain-containing protein n=1 Tax=Amnibacterium setariae TaxID=2306585 RepID=A0A3A1TW61_9MICO|nr:hypothetical protein [Amnibacterium setariae]RIX28462.1 hypothetical protein D1781_13630 [Amnibacterium setariae]